ncbi:hypothetical protein ACHAWO_001645 [Cyclotella atomus]|uniref:Uncharacterized protein n=1 Tax=Cyclotella atomus TaxID=382360 RepID=A0ABD3Q291_9STRA
MKLLDTIDEYGNNGMMPVVLSRAICRIVGKGANEHSTPVYGAIVPHAMMMDLKDSDVETGLMPSAFTIVWPNANTIAVLKFLIFIFNTRRFWSSQVLF